MYAKKTVWHSKYLTHLFEFELSTPNIMSVCLSFVHLILGIFYRAKYLDPAPFYLQGLFLSIDKIYYQ